MKHRSLVLVAVVVGLLLAVAVGAWAYDATQKSEIARGISAGGVNIGGMSASKAKQVLREKLAAPLEQPLTVMYRHRHFRISAEKAHLQTDVDAMVQQAIDKSRGGSFISRTFRDATGGSVDKNVAPIVSYDHKAIARLVRRVQRGVDRAPTDATVTYAGDGLKTVPAKLGLEVRTPELERAI